MSNDTHAIKALIDKHLVRPSYLIMFGSLIVRGVIAVISSAVNYAAAPAWARLILEVVIAIGVIVSGELIVGASAGAWAEGARQLRSLPGLPLTKVKRLALADELRADRTVQLVSCAVGGIISSGYGAVFMVISVSRPSVATIAPEVFALLAAPFAMFYYSALYRTPKQDPNVRAEDLARDGLEKRLAASGERVAAGTYDNRDVAIIQRALPQEQRALFDPLMQRASGEVILTTSDLYRMLGADDETARRKIRRLLSKAAADPESGITRDHAGAYQVPRSRLLDIFPDALSGPGLPPVTPRRPVVIPRSAATQEGTPGAQGAGHQTVDPRRAPGARPAQKEQLVPAGALAALTGTAE